MHIEYQEMIGLVHEILEFEILKFWEESKAYKMASICLTQVGVTLVVFLTRPTRVKECLLNMILS